MNTLRKNFYGKSFLFKIAFICFSFSFIFSGPVYAKNSFLVAPGRVMFDLKRPKTQSFIITNNGDEKIRLSIKPVYFPVDSRSIRGGTPIDPTVKDLEDLTKYIRVAPRSLSLKPGQRRDIRISLRAPGELPDGSYRAHLLVSMLESAQVKKSSVGDNKLGVNLELKLETGIALFGNKGEPDPDMTVTCNIDEESQNLNLKLNNPGAWRFDGFIEVYPASGAGEPLVNERMISYRSTIYDLVTEYTPASAGERYLVKWFGRSGGEKLGLIGTSNCDLGS